MPDFKEIVDQHGMCNVMTQAQSIVQHAAAIFWESPRLQSNHHNECLLASFKEIAKTLGYELTKPTKLPTDQEIMDDIKTNPNNEAK